MSLQDMNEKIKRLQNESVECSQQIIQLKVNNYKCLEVDRQLYYLECKSKKIIEEIKILQQTKKYIKKKSIL